MKKSKIVLAAVLLIVGIAGIAYASATRTKGYICPVTGEVLPSPECCPYSR